MTIDRGGSQGTGAHTRHDLAHTIKRLTRRLAVTTDAGRRATLRMRIKAKNEALAKLTADFDRRKAAGQIRTWTDASGRRFWNDGR
jgi:hypothetical protein